MAPRAAPYSGLTGPRRWTPLSVSAVYFVLSSAYIVVSDALLLAQSLSGSSAWSVGLAKGILFVFATTVLLYVLLNRRQNEIERRERFLSTILDGADAAIFVVDESRTVVAANPAVEKVFGRPTSLLQGASTRLLHVSERSWQDFHARSWPVLEAGRPFRADYPMRRADGSEFLAAIHVSLVHAPGGGHLAVSILEDITEDRRRAEELRHSQALLKQLIENIDRVFWLSTPDTSEILYVSPAFEQVWGRTMDDLYADPLLFMRAVHPEDQARVRAFVERQPHEALTQEYRILRPDGEERWIRDRSFRILDEAGAVFRCAGIAEDVTEEKERQRQLLAAQKREALGQIAGGVAHDFNNMLLVIMGNLEMALDTETDPRRRGALQTAVRAAERGSELAARLLAFGRADALRPIPTDLAVALRDAQAIVSRAVGPRVAIEIRADEALPLAEVDRGQFESAMLNLAINARDAMPKGGSLVFEAAQAAEDGWDHPGVRVSVTDTGMGMDADLAARALEPFVTTKAEAGGSGLGLSSVHAFVRQSGGRIAIRSRPGEGTTVTLAFPPARGARAHGEADSREREPAALGRPRAVLLAEDDPDVAETIGDMVARLGHRVVHAASGEEALAAFHGDPDIDCVIADVVMPGHYDGRDLARLLRAERPDLDLWLMSGHPGDALGLTAGLPAGVRLLVKPVRMGTLRRIL